jgi:SNF2 family DNA or RNA helicase
MDQIEKNKSKFLFYSLEIKTNFPNTNNIIGKTKYEINLEALSKLPICYHNKDAIEYMAIPVDKGGHGWSLNYANESVLKIFDCHAIDYVIEYGEGKQIKIHILFFSLEREELLIPSVIKNDNMIINIINRHIMHYNNLTNINYHNYQFDLLCNELSTNRILDLQYNQNNTICKTALYNYQKDNIQWMINIEANLPIIKFSEHKIFDLGPNLKLYFDYQMSYHEDCFIEYDNFPKRQIHGGIICDETGLGKTIQLLSLAFSRPDIKTLIIVPTHIKQHWENEVIKHFDFKDFKDFKDFEKYILIVNYIEFATMDIKLIALYQRVIVDEIHEMYANEKIKENSMIFNKLLECNNFIYRWGLTATPFIDSTAMLNIIKYLLGTKEIYNPSVGNYIMIQNEFKSVFRKNTKLNVEYELKLPEVSINNILLDFNRYEREIYNAELIGNENKDIQFLRQLCCNVLISVCKDSKNVITPLELKALTLNRFAERVQTEKEQLDLLIQKKINVERELEYVSEHASEYASEHKGNLSYISDYKHRINHLENNIKARNLILERRIAVYESYKSMTENIEAIINSGTLMDVDDNIDSNTDDNTDGAFEHDRMCPICYSPFSGNIALFIVCRHYFCHECFERNHKLRPNQCLMCRSQAEPGEINFIGDAKQQFTCTKNIEILKLIKTSGERFIIFTQYDKLIKSISYLLQSNDINVLTYSDFSVASQETMDITQVIILSSNVNASGIDLSFIHNVIIMEPFENYIYSKEIEKQLIGRVHRINQNHKVNVYRLIIKNTIEEDIYSYSLSM